MVCVKCVEERYICREQDRKCVITFSLRVDHPQTLHSFSLLLPSTVPNPRHVGIKPPSATRGRTWRSEIVPRNCDSQPIWATEAGRSQQNTITVCVGGELTGVQQDGRGCRRALITDVCVTAAAGGAPRAALSLIWQPSREFSSNPKACAHPPSPRPSSQCGGRSPTGNGSPWLRAHQAAAKMVEGSCK